MAVISDAVGLERLSKVVGWKITKGDFSNTTPNLPQRIVLLGEANTANQSGLVTTARQLTTSKDAGELYGYGSPMHRMMEILKPQSGGGLIGGIPIIGYAQTAAVSSVAKVITLTATGTPTAAGTHTLVVNGRRSLNGIPYEINITLADTVTTIAAKVVTMLTNILGAPVTATSALGVVTATSKWTGLTSNDNNISVDTNGASLGITWAVAEPTAGTGTPSIQAALDLFGNTWNTIVINPYVDSTTYTTLETFNGIPDPTTPTGRYTGTIFLPFVALTGSTLADPSSITDARKLNDTIAICPAPLSKGLPMEAAANMACLFARTAQDTPAQDVTGLYYPDMPVPSDGNIGAMGSYDSRDAIVKKGCSTVMLVNGVYQVVDFVTTYHPVGEEPAQFRYCRNLMVDFNIRFGYYLKEQTYVVGKILAKDADRVSAANVIKPKSWKGIVQGYIDDLTDRALIADAEFSKSSVTVGISGTNPDRLETFFRYKRTGTARIASTTVQAGFNFG